MLAYFICYVFIRYVESSKFFDVNICQQMKFQHMSQHTIFVFIRYVKFNMMIYMLIVYTFVHTHVWMCACRKIKYKIKVEY